MYLAELVRPRGSPGFYLIVASGSGVIFFIKINFRARNILERYVQRAKIHQLEAGFSDGTIIRVGSARRYSMARNLNSGLWRPAIVTQQDYYQFYREMTIWYPEDERLSILNV